MTDATGWLRTSFRIGVLADGIAAALMLAQAAFGVQSMLNAYPPDVPYRWAMGLAGSLMLGWTVLLLWGHRRPVQRRDVLLITNVVILGLMGAMLYGLRTGFLVPAAGWTVVVLQGGLIALFTASYVYSRKVHPVDPAPD